MIRNPRTYVEGRQPRRLVGDSAGQGGKFIWRLGALVESEELGHLVHDCAILKRGPAKIIWGRPAVDIPGKIIAALFHHALGMDGQSLVRLMALEGGNRRAPVIGVTEAPRRRFDVDSAAP